MFTQIRESLKNKKREEIAKLEDQIFAKQRELKDVQYEIETSQRNLKLKEEDFEKRKRDELGDIARRKRFADEDHQRALSQKDSEIKKIKEEAKIENENNAITLKLDYEKKLAEQQKKNNEEMSEKMKSLHEENYAKLSEALSKLHSEGNASTKFMTEIAQGLISSTSKNLNSHTSRLEYVQGKEEK